MTAERWTHSDEYCWPAALCDACRKRLSRDDPVTAVDVDALDKLREALAEAMASSARGNTYAQWAATILPVVVQFATQRAAAELRAAAKWALLEAASHEGYAAKSMSRNSDLREAEARVFRAASNRLTGRADALDAS